MFFFMWSIWKKFAMRQFKFNFNEKDSVRFFFLCLFSFDTNCTILYSHNKEYLVKWLFERIKKRASRTNKHLSSAPIWYYTLNANWLQNVAVFFLIFVVVWFYYGSGFCLVKICSSISSIEIYNAFALWCWQKMPTTRKRNVYKQTIGN